MLGIGDDFLQKFNSTLFIQFNEREGYQNLSLLRVSVRSRILKVDFDEGRKTDYLNPYSQIEISRNSTHI